MATATMLDYTEIPRIDVRGNVDEIARLVKAARPFIAVEGNNEDFREYAGKFGIERFRSVFGSREWRVQRAKRGEFDPWVPVLDNTTLLPFGDFLDKIEEPDEEFQYYLNLWTAPGLDFAAPLFNELSELGRKLPSTRYKNQELRVFWLGGAGNITPLHYDTYARTHGVVWGEKVFELFPPDLRHYRILEPYPLRSPLGWYSRLGVEPLDPERFPKLRKARGYRALCVPGDILYLPPCWWHRVSIPRLPTLTISATFYPKSTYLYWYHWRMRLARKIGGQEMLLNKRKPVAASG